MKAVVSSCSIGQVEFSAIYYKNLKIFKEIIKKWHL